MRRLRRWLLRPGDERGSAAIEAAIGVPAFMLFVGLIIFAGRSALAHQAVQTAAYDAARAASIARTVGAAQSDAHAAAATALANRGLRCASTSVSVDTSGLGAALGSYGSVIAQVTCRVDLSDLVVPGVPGSRTVTASMSSPVDAYRERG